MTAPEMHEYAVKRLSKNPYLVTPNPMQCPAPFGITCLRAKKTAESMYMFLKACFFEFRYYECNGNVVAVQGN